MSAGRFAVVVALELVQAERHRDALSLLRLLRDVHRRQAADEVIGQLVRHVLALLDDVFDCDAEDIDDYLAALLHQAQGEQPA